MCFAIPSEIWTWTIGIVSTLLGAGAGWFASLKVYRTQLQDQMLTSAFSTLIHVQVAYSNLVAIKKHIDQCLAQSKIVDEDLWTKVIPVVGGNDIVAVSPADLAFFARAREYKLMQDIITLSMRLEAISAAMSEYKLLRIELLREMKNESIDGEVFSGSISPDQLRQLRPRMFELNSLVRSVISSLSEDLPLARDVFNRLGPAGQKYFGRNKFPNVQAVE